MNGQTKRTFHRMSIGAQGRARGPRANPSPSIFFFKQKTAYEIVRWLEFRRVLFRSPEAQAILLRLLDDPVPLLLRTSEGTLEEGEGLRWDPRVAVCVVAASGGYPGPIETGRRIRSEEHTSELQSPYDLVCRLLLEKK